jgi:hydrogenase maturation factor
MSADGIEYDALFYPYLFAGGTASAREVLAQVQQSTLEKCQETIALRRATLEQSGKQMMAAARALILAFASGATMLAFGNGGSATDVEDLVGELLHPPFPDCSPLPAIALTNDSAIITAIGNDVGIEHVFARQLIAFARPGDIALGISTSGNSANMLLAFEQAHRQSMLTIALTGYDGGKLAHSPDVDICIISPGEHIPRIQEAQATVYHALLEVVHIALKTPPTAVTLLRARAEGIKNFSIFCNHVTIIPAIKAILDSPGLRLDGFVGPGHVSMIIGMRPYTFIARDHHKPVVISGFEPLDIVQSVSMIAKQISERRAEIENQYARVVRPEGNVRALQAMARTMELRPIFEWRGMGFITQSALKLRAEFAQWDAEQRFTVPGIRVADPKACQCGEVLKGVIKPWNCKVFGTACTPETPIGTCMVSSEGACAAYYNYGRFSLASERSHLPS